MKVVLTETAEDCLWAIWNHDRIYSEQLADTLQREIDQFIRNAIGAHPEIGHVLHAPRGIRRLIFRGRHNIFYTLRDNMAFILFIFDGRIGLARKVWRAPTEEPGGVLWETGTDRRRSFGVKRCGWH